jgi:hypothetical protein
MHGKPNQWCDCCTNDRVKMVAEEIIAAAAQKHYISEMCVGSLTDAIYVAAFYMGVINADKISHSTGLPVGIAHAAEEERCQEVIREVMRESPANVASAIARIAKSLITVRQMADDAAAKKAGL